MLGRAGGYKEILGRDGRGRWERVVRGLVVECVWQSVVLEKNGLGLGDAVVVGGGERYL